MASKITVDEADLLAMYSDIENPRAGERVRRLLREAETVDDTDAESARLEGFAAGLFVGTLAFEAEDEEPATESEAREQLQPQFEYGVIHTSEHDEEDLYVSAKGTNIQQKMKEVDMPNGWTCDESDYLPAIKFYGPENDSA